MPDRKDEDMPPRMTKTKEGYYKGQHSFFLLQYHLVLVTKYRRPVLNDKIADYLKDYTKRYFGERSAPVSSIEVMPDHIHILFETAPTHCLSEFINAYKSASSRLIRSQYKDEIAKWYSKPILWSTTYFIGSVSERTAKAVKHYIETQKDAD